MRLLPFLALALAAPANAVTIDWVPIGDPGNAPNVPLFCWDGLNPCGSVGYEYMISKYEVTNAQYAEFLNSQSDLNVDFFSLWRSIQERRIERLGAPGSYTYAPVPGQENTPVRVFDRQAIYFANWLNNDQGSAGFTSGSYSIPPGSTIQNLTRSQDARIVLPTYDEWHKAAAYDAATGTYWEYATQSNVPGTCSGPTDAPNSANCNGYPTRRGVVDVGSYPNSPSPYGTFDQSGNINELIELVFEDDSEEPILFYDLGVAGGAWFDVAMPGVREVQALGNGGVRLVMLVAEPGTAALLVLGLAGVARAGGFRLR